MRLKGWTGCLTVNERVVITMEPDSKAKKIANTILNLIKETIETYESNKERIKHLEDEQQDLLHEIEMAVKLDAVRRSYVVNKLRRVRQERRRLKNENEALKYIYSYFKNNEKFENGLEQQRLYITQTEGKIKALCYNARVRDDLTIAKKKEA